MPFLATQLQQLAPGHNPSRPLPRKLERLARLVADGELTHQQIADALRVSRWSVWRLRDQPVVAARIAWLRERAIQRAYEDEPLAEKRQRILFLAAKVRELDRQLEANKYETVLGVSKQGNPITGFDRARVGEIRQYIADIRQEVEPRHSTIAEQQSVAVQVTMTTADVVTKVQALLSRAAPADVYKEGDPPMPLPRGVEGGMLGSGTLDESGVVLDTEHAQFSGAKEVLDTEYTNFLDAKAVEVKRDE